MNGRGAGTTPARRLLLPHVLRSEAVHRRAPRSTQVTRVHVPTAQALRCEVLTRVELEEVGGEPLRQACHAGWATARTVLAALQSLPPGEYLLSAANRAITVYRGLTDDAWAEGAEGHDAAGGTGAPPLPLHGARMGVVYDLHAAHADSGRAAPQPPPFVPPVWRPADAKVPQIPYTFPPR